MVAVGGCSVTALVVAGPVVNVCDTVISTSCVGGCWVVVVVVDAAVDVCAVVAAAPAVVVNFSVVVSAVVGD